LATRGYAAIARHARVLLLDLAGVSFCDASGLSALIRIAGRAGKAGCRHGLIAVQPQVVRCCGTLGWISGYRSSPALMMPRRTS
jgi:anti-sigma B factor antagonist